MKNRLHVSSTTRRIAITGIFSAVAIVLMYLEIALPLMPSFLKFDFSEIPVLIAGFALGPVTAIIIELIKNMAHMPVSQTSYVGELANFIMGCALVVPAAVIYKTMKKRTGAIIGMIVGTLTMTLTACLVNYFVMIPFYANVIGYPVSAFIEMANKAGNKLVVDLWTLILFVFVPFNLFKGFVVSLIVLLIYKKISHLLHKPGQRHH